jgi:pSer/pThr/pTyr-binding forkhead associated (FHA) protein
LHDIDAIAAKADALIGASRLHQIAVIISSERSDRIVRLAEALKRLSAGAFLLGTGPSTVGIFPLTVEEVIIGRMATPGEAPSSTVVDFVVNDCLYLVPHEVSRRHAKIYRRIDSAGVSHRIMDLNSTCGTFVNGEQLASGVEGRILVHGDVISLGPRQISTYLFYVSR